MEIFGRRRTGSSSAEMQATGSRVLSKTRYRIVVMGAAAVGKTCIVSRLLYAKFLTEYKETVEELHSGQYEINGLPLTLDILDTSGSFQFPAMRRLSITMGDAFVLVYSVDNAASFEAVKRLRQEIIFEKTKEAAAEDKGGSGAVSVPIVIVGNKTDLQTQKTSTTNEEGGTTTTTTATLQDSTLPRLPSLMSATADTTASIDWGHGYVEVSAKDDVNIVGIFKELLAQVDLRMVPDVDPATVAATVDQQRKAKYFSKLHKQPGKHSKLSKRNSCHVS